MFTFKALVQLFKKNNFLFLFYIIYNLIFLSLFIIFILYSCYVCFNISALLTFIIVVDLLRCLDILAFELKGSRIWHSKICLFGIRTILSWFFFFNLFFYSCVGSSFLCEGLLQLRQVGATLHHGARAPHHRGLSRCGAQAPDAQAQQLWLTGPVALRHVGSSQTRAQTHVPCIGRQTLNHCATREALSWLFWEIEDTGESLKTESSYSFVREIFIRRGSVPGREQRSLFIWEIHLQGRANFFIKHFLFSSSCEFPSSPLKP